MVNRKGLPEALALDSRIMNIGILDIQGSREEHFAILKKIGVKPKLVKNFEGLDGLILPGGESTTILGLIDELPKDIPIFGTCAGVIILKHFGLIDAEIERNAYGGQLHSFETELNVPVLGKKPVYGIFIRAPKIKKVGSNVKVLAEYNSDPVMVRQGKILATTFHPELTTDTRVHKYFLKMCDEYRRTN